MSDKLAISSLKALADAFKAAKPEIKEDADLLKLGKGTMKGAK